ncbi:MAG: hypothetical protein ABIS03_11875, partial [Gemmatimonadaceae bacterium]
MKRRLILALAAFVLPGQAHSQVVPGDRWYTIETDHFRVHFTRPLESEGRRAAVNAERAFAELSSELKPPGGKVELVIADNYDYVNGYATPIPTNRIVIFAHPPIDAAELRNYDDWSRLVITHELTHIFHLDRAEGIWRVGRNIFGRHPALFPNAYQPSWVTEGLAVYYESRVTGSGRLEGSEHSMLARAAAEVNRVPRIGELSRATTRFPGGESVYAYGGLIFDYLSRTRGPEKISKFIDRTSRVILPLSLNARAKGVFGISFENAWNDWQRELVARSSHRDPLAGWRDLTTNGRSVDFPRWSDDSTIIFGASTGREITGEYAVGLNGDVTRIARRNARDSNVPLPDGGIVFAQPDFVDAFHYRSDLWISKDGHESRLTRGARLAQPDVNRDGKVVAVQSVPGSSRLVMVAADGSTISPITEGDAAVQWAEPRWSPDGALIAAVRIDRGTSSVMLMNPDGSNQRVLIAQRAVVATPSWSPAGTDILFSSDVSGVTQAYSMAVAGEGELLKQLTTASTGFFYPVLSPDGRLLAGTTLRYDGYHLGVAPLASVDGVPSTLRKSPREGCLNCRLASEVTTSLTEANLPRRRRYSPWRTLAPQYWEPVVSQASGSGTAIGAATSGSDVIGRHSFSTQALY